MELHGDHRGDPLKGVVVSTNPAVFVSTNPYRNGGWRPQSGKGTLSDLGLKSVKIHVRKQPFPKLPVNRCSWMYVRCATPLSRLFPLSRPSKISYRPKISAYIYERLFPARSPDVVSPTRFAPRARSWFFLSEEPFNPLQPVGWFGLLQP